MYTRFAERVARRGMAGGGGGGDRSTLYGRLMMDHPLPTSIATATVLWASGDLIAQYLDKLENKDSEFQSKRFAGVVTHGILLGGVGNYYWYNGLEHFVCNTLRLSAGTLRFVGAKIGLEIAIWHPIGLMVYWCIVGTAEGHSKSKIERELRKDYLPTLLGDICLWTPCDILTFWRVPVQYQGLFINCGSLFEAVALSWVHKHGTGGGEKIEEEKTSAGALFISMDRFLHIPIDRNISPDQIKKQIDAQFDRMDRDKNGFLSLHELQSGSDLLPGVDDAAVSAKVLELLHRLADEDGDGKISREEYSRLILKFCEGGYRHDFLADVVISIFDENNDGEIEAKEVINILKVYGLPHSPADVKKFIEATDTNKDGRISRDELRALDTNKDGRISRDELRAALRRSSL